MNLSEKQVDVIRFASIPEATTLLAGGAVRSGKSFSILMSFAIWLVAQRESHDHAIVGQSIESIMRNMGFDFIEAVERIYGARARIDKTFGTRIVVDGKVKQNVWIIGANDAKARRRIQGSTLKGLVIEELTLIPEDFFRMAWSRLSVDGAKCWASYNPEGPSHWAKKTVVDKAGDYGGRVIRFLMRDNPTLSDAVIDRYERSFTGHFYQRYIAGEWAAAAGACYPHVVKTADTRPMDGGLWHLALDWAVSGTLAALAINSKGPRAIVRFELYHEGRTDGLLTEVEVADRIQAWWLVEHPGSTCGALAWVDPSTPATFKRELRKRGFTIRAADNDVVPGIVTTASRLASGDVLIHEGCERLLEEVAGYVWDDVAAEQGEDKPVKKADHGCDALRYWAHSTGKAYRYIKATSVREALR